MNDNRRPGDKSADSERAVYLLAGHLRSAHAQVGDEGYRFNALVRASSDRVAIEQVLAAAKQEGYATAELSGIGVVDEPPSDGMIAQAFEDAMQGEVALIVYRE